MNAAKLLEQSHLLVLQTIDDFPERLWDTPGVCENWSVKDIIAHLTAYEYLLVDALNKLLVSDTPTPYLDKFVGQQEDFNQREVAARQYSTAQQVIDEYNEMQLQSSDLLTQVPVEKLTQAGTLPGYGKDRSVADMINTISKHTSEHCTQIKAFRIKEQA